MFGVLYAAEGTARAELEAVAREFSPRVELVAAREITLDLSGVARLFGDARTVAEEMRRTAADRGLRVRVAIAPTRSAARLLVHHRAGITVVEDDVAVAVAPLPLALLAAIANAPNDPNANGPNEPNANEPNANEPNANEPNDPNAPNDPNPLLKTLRRWGLRTLGELAALPPGAVAARLGQEGVEWQRLACGADPRPLVPAVPEERFEQALDLEWPIEGLEPLSFVLARLLEPLEAHLMRRDRGAAVLHVRLHLVDKSVHERSLELPAPMRDARALRTLALLDLESHPPAAAIDRVGVAVDPTPGRVVQFSLLTRALPSPERLSTLLARLTAVMGEGRCGSPAAVDTWQPGAFAMQPFAPTEGGVERVGRVGRIGENSEISSLHAPLTPLAPPAPRVALRRCRSPLPARVRVEEGRPVRVSVDRSGFGGGRVETAAGPWRTSGNWWQAGSLSWDRDEWDVALADGVTYRVFHERATDAWFVDGIVD